MNNGIPKLLSIFAEHEAPHIEGIFDNSAEANTGSSTLRECVLELSIPTSLAVFTGHFPDHPVLPGIVQIDWAARIAEQYFEHTGRFQKLSNVKFTSMVFPNTKLALKLAYNPEKNHVKFTYCSLDTVYSSGTLVYST